MEKMNSLFIVDDDVMILTELTYILRNEYKIYTAKDGTSALEKIEKYQPDLVLLDVLLPDMNGFDILCTLKKSESTKNIPVIFITGISETEHESEGLAIGAVDYIRKPFDDMVVKLRVRHQIQIINLQRDLEYTAKVAELANQTKSSFLANMSHEIRTPMNAILGVTEILIQRDTLPEDIEEGLGRIYNSCDLLLGIINDILDFSKIEAGKLDIMPMHYKVASMINDSAHLNMMRIDSKPIEFELQIDENIPANLIGDELRIKQILNNLLSNAFKYTDAGKVTLSVSFETVMNGILLVLSVRDTGHGMTEGQLKKLFVEYSRFNTEKNFAIEGTGLGLAITKRLINLMNGVMNVESEPGKGSLFTVKLLQGVVDPEIIGKEVASNLQQFRMSYMMHRKRGQIARDPMPYGNVLIVDDMETNIYVAVGLMKLYKLQIDTAINGHEAICKIKEGKVYDVIFMDHMMPEMDGIETTKIIRDLGYTEPIVALTANAVTGQMDLFLQNGFDDFISKPIDIRQLNSALNRLVRDKQPQDVIEAARQQKAESSNVNIDTHSLEDTPLLMESFIREAGKAITWLDEHSIELDNEDILRKYTIIVHGIKSSLWNIGETRLAELAFNLEKSGRDKDIEYIKKSTPDLIKDLRRILEKLKSRQNIENVNQEFVHDDTEDLCVKLREIIELSSNYDRKGVLDILAGIKNCSKETKAVLDDIMGYVTHSEFEDAQIAAASYMAVLALHGAQTRDLDNLCKQGKIC
ncbi:MAG: response regulator [Treponema sp.]|nr:response regulator [Treponema sp.]